MWGRLAGGSKTGPFSAARLLRIGLNGKRLPIFPGSPRLLAQVQLVAAHEKLTGFQSAGRCQVRMGLRTLLPGSGTLFASASFLGLRIRIMFRDVFYHQRCPVCGRMLQIRVNLLGRRVYCQHCGGGFVALDEQPRVDGERPVKSAADRADELLQRAALVLERAGLASEEG